MRATNTNLTIYQFGEFRVDVAARTLARGGSLLAVPKRVFDCLLLIIELRDRAVSRDELIRAVWKRDNVSANQLAQLIVAARRLFSDDSASNRYIRTVSGFGYQWVFPVESDCSDANASTSASSSISTGLIETADLNVDLSDDDAYTAPLLETELATPTPVSLEVNESALQPSLSSAFDSGTDSVADSTHSAANSGVAQRRYTAVFFGISFAVLVLLFIFAWRFWPQSAPNQNTPIASASNDAITDSGTESGTSYSPKYLQQWRGALRQGHFDEVRAALLALSPQDSARPEIVLLEIDVDIARGRWENALTRLTLETARLQGDDLAQARLLLRKSTIAFRQRASAAAMLEPAQSAWQLFALAARATPADMAEALMVRGRALTLAGQSEAGAQDFVQSRRYALIAGDELAAADAAGNLARYWARSGRNGDAVDLLQQNIAVREREHDTFGEILDRTGVIPLLIERLRWPQALVHGERLMQLLPATPESARRCHMLQLYAFSLIGVGRLRQAGMVLDDADAEGAECKSRTAIRAAWHLARAEFAEAQAQALPIADRSYAEGDPRAESRDHALLIWVLAAHGLQTQDMPLPAPSVQMQTLLAEPETIVGQIACGRWLAYQGERQQAQAVLLRALQQARDKNYLLQMLMTVHALADSAEGDEFIAVEQAWQQLQSYDPGALETDYVALQIALQLSAHKGDAAQVAKIQTQLEALAGERVLKKP